MSRLLFAIALLSIAACGRRQIDPHDLEKMRAACERNAAQFIVVYNEDGTANRTRCIEWGKR